MNASDSTSLQNLNDIVSPGEVSWWPLATGWYVLAVAVAIAAAWLSFRVWRQWRSDRYRRVAIKELADIRSQPEDRLALLPGLLKRTALSAWPRTTVAALSGGEWHRFLDHSAAMDLFTQDAGVLLDRAAYKTAAASELNGAEQQVLLEAAEKWIRQHQAGRAN